MKSPSGMPRSAGQSMNDQIGWDFKRSQVGNMDLSQTQFQFVYVDITDGKLQLKIAQFKSSKALSTISLVSRCQNSFHLHLNDSLKL